MEKKQTSPELTQPELLPTQEEQVAVSPPPRKRRLDRDDDDAEPRKKRAPTTQPTSEPAPLTRKNLAFFDSETSAPTDDSESKTTSTTMSKFAIKANQNGILEPRSSEPPQNLEHIRTRLTRSRRTAPPSESEYHNYVDQVQTAKNEATMVAQTGRMLLKQYPKGYDKVFNHAFTGYPKEVGFNTGLSAPQPDFVEGFPIDEHTCGTVLYKDDPYSLALPHLAGEWKAPGKNLKEAGMQAAYDGAALVYARKQALDAAKEPDLAGHAKVTTFTTDGSTLNLFAHYAAETEDGKLQYHQYPIKSLSLVDSHDSYKEGRKQLRNAQDLAKEESYALRDKLKNYRRQPRDSLDSIAEGVPPLSVPDLEPLDTTHAYEDSRSHHLYSQHSHHSHSTPHSSKAPPSTHSCIPGSGQARKAPSSHASSHASSRNIGEYKRFWKKDVMSGRYYHKHSDGTVSWLDEEDERD